MPESKRILVVEDDAELRTAITIVLEDEGYEIDTAENGAVALDLLRTRTPRLILLDMKMPVMDGWTFARELKVRFPGIAPVVVMTAAEDARQRAADVGAEGWVGKPFELEALLETVRRHLAPLQAATR